MRQKGECSLHLHIVSGILTRGRVCRTAAVKYALWDMTCGMMHIQKQTPRAAGPRTLQEEAMADKKQTVPSPERKAAGDKKSALETALSQIEKQFGKGAVMKLGQNLSLIHI